MNGIDSLTPFFHPHSVGGGGRIPRPGWPRRGRTSASSVKSGRTGAGEQTVGSHTASLTGSDSAVDAFFGQTG